MRKQVAVSVAITGLMLGLAACGGEDATMPDVAGSKLDLALSDIERAGYNPDDVEVIGGGALGVIDEGNWTVCEQEPRSGTLIDASPRLTVDRECEGEDRPTDDADEEATDQPAPSSSENVTSEVGPIDELEEDSKSTFTMPSLVGANLQDAQDKLQSLGSFLLTQTDATGAERFQVLDSNWKVCFQNPAPGTSTSFSALVELGAVKLDETCP